MADEPKPTEATASAEAKPANGVANPLMLKLRKTIVANGDEVNELVFREPTAADIERVGNPVLIDPFVDPPKLSFDTKVMTQMMAWLAAVPPSTVRQMHPKDWNQAAWKLLGFFTPDL